MAGHSKWAQIKYRKALTDAKKSKVFSKISALISVAARKGSDPSSNIALREAISRAREVNMPQGNVERAIKRGTGELPGATIEESIFEAYGPGGVALLIYTITDNRNRTLNEVREILRKYDGKLAEAGSVRWLFEEMGRIYINELRWTEGLELWLIEQGARDIEKEGDNRVISVAKGDFERLRNELSKKDTPFESRLEYAPKTTLPIVDASTKEKLEALFEELDDKEDVEDIYSNALFA